MDKVRFGMLGCGNIGTSHAKNFMKGKIETTVAKPKEPYFIRLNQENRDKIDSILSELRKELRIIMSGGKIK